MQTSKDYLHSNKTYYNNYSSVPVTKPGIDSGYTQQTCYQSPQYVSSSDEGSYPQNPRSNAQSQPYCTLESSATIKPNSHNSPSCYSFSPDAGGSPLSDNTNVSNGSPNSISCITIMEEPHHNQDELQQKLRELESAMLGPDSDAPEDYEILQSGTNDASKWMQLMGIPRGDLKQLLVYCAKAVDENDLFAIQWMVPELRQMVSISGTPMQRLGAYLLEGLVARLENSGSSIYKALKCKEPTSSDLMSYMHALYEACPYFKFGYLSANGAIAEAVKGADSVHIIDFQIAQGTQWTSLIQALAARPGGPPRIRITGIDDAQSAYARGGGLHMVGMRLSHVAAKCGVPFEFHPLDMDGSEIRREHLNIRYGDALAVNFAFQLHHMSDESVDTENHRDRLIRLIKSLNPTVVALVEQESNTNTSPFFQRFCETLDYYTAIFESIDVSTLLEHNKRISVEQHCLARDIVNIIACEGKERVERHELFGKWRARFSMAGFRPCPLSPLVNATIKTLLESYSPHYWLNEIDGVLYLGWKQRRLVVSCAWR